MTFGIGIGIWRVHHFSLLVLMCREAEFACGLVSDLGSPAIRDSRARTELSCIALRPAIAAQRNESSSLEAEEDYANAEEQD